MAAVTYGTLKRSILELISDDVIEADLYGSLRGVQTSELLLFDAVTAALAAVSTRCWKHSTFNVEGGVSSAVLPDELIEVEAVRDLETGLFLPSIPLKISQVFSDGWTVYPQGSITFNKQLSDKGAQVFYSAVWDTPVEDVYFNIDTFEHDFPLILLTPIKFYSAFYCLFNRGVQSAILRQYNTKVDSGDPLDNPILTAAEKAHAQFEIELKRIPASQKGVTF
jgi:hypothetical protein